MSCFIRFIVLIACYGGLRVATLVPYLASGMGSNIIGLEHTFVSVFPSHSGFTYCMMVGGNKNDLFMTKFVFS